MMHRAPADMRVPPSCCRGKPLLRLLPKPCRRLPLPPAVPRYYLAIPPIKTPYLRNSRKTFDSFESFSAPPDKNETKVESRLKHFRKFYKF